MWIWGLFRAGLIQGAATREKDVVAVSTFPKGYPNTLNSVPVVAKKSKKKIEEGKRHDSISYCSYIMSILATPFQIIGKFIAGHVPATYGKFDQQLLFFFVKTKLCTSCIFFNYSQIYCISMDWCIRCLQIVTSCSRGVRKMAFSPTLVLDRMWYLGIAVSRVIVGRTRRIRTNFDLYFYR